jgi:hypothetical protein
VPRASCVGKVEQQMWFASEQEQRPREFVRRHHTSEEKLNMPLN